MKSLGWCLNIEWKESNIAEQEIFYNIVCGHFSYAHNSSIGWCWNNLPCKKCWPACIRVRQWNFFQQRSLQKQIRWTRRLVPRNGQSKTLVRTRHCYMQIFWNTPWKQTCVGRDCNWFWETIMEKTISFCQAGWYMETIPAWWERKRNLQPSLILQKIVLSVL